ncbi:Otogelin-like protein [Acipenser ruthenus]|uniref:Otogelin-like protein n=1 Tax=Acipenser ruthenus TaxID=7906 RepID=A0A444UC70_ACIRT|nr:Otogelin-like protein [Acipenser ruthenus]
MAFLPLVPNMGQDRDGICRSWGQHHYESFDGIYYYFPGTCSYILAKDCHATEPQYTIWVHNSRDCDGSVYSCHRSLSLFFPNKDEIHIIGHEVKKGGIRLTLPLTIGNVFMERLADYILVKSTFGFSLAWDGSSGVYIKMTEEHKGRPCGLCGNYNDDGADDLTTSYRPTDMLPAVPVIYVCKSAYCLSEDDDTFCRAVTEYTRACSHAGYPVREWRESFPACTLTASHTLSYCHFAADGCENSFVHRDCISCCPPTCTFERECLGSNLHCLDGCYCPDGLIMENGSCISVANCPCVYHGTSYPLGYVLEQGCSVCTCGKTCLSLSNNEACDDDCAEGCNCAEGLYYDEARQRCVADLCRNGRMECAPEEPEPDPGECPPGKTYFNCRDHQPGQPRTGIACEVTCRNLMLNLTCPPATPCVRGCGCPAGVCHRGFFNCTHYPCPSVCTVYSDRHYHTFDGLEYDYVSDCQVYLVKSINGTEVSITAQNKDCYESGIICMKYLVIFVGLTKIYFTDNSGDPSSSSVIGKGYEFQLWKAGYYTVIHFQKQEITILWDKKTTVHIQAGPEWKGLLTGMCGNFDKNTVNDMTTASNMEVSNAQALGDSWALGQCESDYVVKRPCEGDLIRQPYAKRECAILYSDAFASCHNVVDVTWFYKNCLTDTCNCNRGGDCECLCTSIAAYAHKCCQQGVAVNWRSPTVCFKISAEGKVLFNLMIIAGLYKDRYSRGYDNMFFTGLPVISFESAERPNYFLCASEDGSLRLEQWSASEEFRRQATYFHHQGLGMAGYSSFELYSQKGFFITLTRTAARALGYDYSEEFKHISSFTIEGIILPPTPTPYMFVTKSNRTTTAPTTTSATTTAFTTLAVTETETSSTATSTTEHSTAATTTSYATVTTTASTLVPLSPLSPVATLSTSPSVSTVQTSTVTESPTTPPFLTTSRITSTLPTLSSEDTRTTSTMTFTSQPEVLTTEVGTTTQAPLSTVTSEVPPTSSTLYTRATTTSEGTVYTSVSTFSTEGPSTLQPATVTEPFTTALVTAATSVSSPTPYSMSSAVTETTPVTTGATTAATTELPSSSTELKTTLSTVSESQQTTTVQTADSGRTSPSLPDTTAFTNATEVSTPALTSTTVVPVPPFPLTSEVTHTSLFTSVPSTVTETTPPGLFTGPITTALSTTETPIEVETSTQEVTTATPPSTNTTLTDHATYSTVIPSILQPTSTCTPPYSYRVDECSEYICFNGHLMFHNASLQCRNNVSQPNCGILGMPVQINKDNCCPQWECPCRCSIISDLRVITFDGNNVALYDNGSYILVHLPRENIVAHIEKCPTSETPTGGTSGLCFKKLNITTHSYKVLINRLERKVSVNFINARLPFTRQSLHIDDTGTMYVINTPGGVSIQWYHSTGIIVLQYSPPYNTTSGTRGLCGCCDGNPEDDLKLPNGTVIKNVEDIPVFLYSWMVHTSEETDYFRRVGDNCTTGNCTKCFQMLNQNPFTVCHDKVSPEQFCDKIWAGDLHYKNHECDFLAAYVAICYTHNICINWRTQEFCPLKCPPGKEYQACVSTCKTKTCQNREYYEESTCSYIREECVCKSGTILHRADSAFCVTEEQCVCTDNEGGPRAPGEVWKGSSKGCCMYKCMENGSIIAVEPECSEVPSPICEREGEYVIDVIEEGACCPKKICECNLTICDNEVPACENGNKLMIVYSTISCCPDYRCECDSLACPTATPPECREDQFLVEVREDKSCCYSYLCVCESCIDPIPLCSEGEILAVDLNTTHHCCPQYQCEKTDVCLFQGVTVLSPGQSMIQYFERDLCYMVHCLQEIDPGSGFHAMDVATVNCSEKCGAAGSTWVSNCTRFDCVESAVGAVVLGSGVVCPPFNDTECVQSVSPASTPSLCAVKERFSQLISIQLITAAHNTSVGSVFLHFMFFNNQGETHVEDPDFSSACGCTRYFCKKTDVCLFQGVTVLSPGQSMIQYFERDLCYMVHCLQEIDPGSGFHAMDVATVNCSEKCGAHQVYVPSSDPHICCGSCKNVSCTFTNENGTIDLYRAGSTWVSNCTRFDCVESAVGAVVLGSGVVCPPFNDTECVQNGGTVQSYIDGCCKKCKDDGRTCKKVTIRTTIRKDDCRSSTPVTVTSCDGKCPSATIFNFNINSHGRFCKCCRESGLETRTVPLYCSRNSTSVDYVFQEPTDCTCQWN